MSDAYPKELAEYVFHNWDAEIPSPTGNLSVGEEIVLPDIKVLEHLFSICYQASLTSHEGEPVVFRMLVADPGQLAEDGGPPAGLQKLEFIQRISMTAAELRRLSAAARFSRSMIGVSLDLPQKPEIWGMINTGPRWLHASHGGRGSAPPLPPYLLIKVMGPGIIEVSKGNRSLVSLSDGKLLGLSLNVFRASWLQEWFAPVRQERMEIYQNEKQSAQENWPDLEPDLTRVIDQHMMKRVIAVMRAFRHGGTLILVPPEQADELMRPNPYLTMKYKFAGGKARARFRALIVEVMRTLARLPVEPARPIKWSDYQQTTDTEIMRLDEAIFELSHLISALSVADGAVILTKGFELLGFGAEIHCEAEEVISLAKSLDLEGTEYREESVLGVGTRHRSAYRLCQRLKDALAIVVSQEGTVQFVRWNENRLMAWEHQGSFDFSAIH